MVLRVVKLILLLDLAQKHWVGDLDQFRVHGRGTSPPALPLCIGLLPLVEN